MPSENGLTKSLRAWRNGVLELPESASPEATRRRCFERLAESQFAPNAETMQAIRLCEQSLSEANDEENRHRWERFRESLRAALVADLKSHRTAYFETPPETRRESWSDLRDRARDFLPIQHRLRHLEVGLDLPSSPPPGMTGDVAWLAQQACHWYLSEPTRRCRMLCRFFEANSEESAQRLKRAAIRLKIDHPEWAAIAMPLLNEIERNEAFSIVGTPRADARSRRRWRTQISESLVLLVIVAALFTVPLILMMNTSTNRRTAPDHGRVTNFESKVPTSAEIAEVLARRGPLTANDDRILEQAVIMIQLGKTLGTMGHESADRLTRMIKDRRSAAENSSKKERYELPRDFLDP